jgi:hypothetical protein
MQQGRLRLSVNRRILPCYCIAFVLKSHEKLRICSSLIFWTLLYQDKSVIEKQDFVKIFFESEMVFLFSKLSNLYNFN